MKNGKHAPTHVRAMAFRFDYDPGAIVYGRGCTSEIEAELADLGVDNALVVTGRTVGTTPAVIEPVRNGTGNRLAGIFAETTPEKTIETALDGVERMHADAIDGLVSLGGGSSLDIAKVMSILAAREGLDRATVRNDFRRTGTLSLPDGKLPPVVCVPTTLAGADLSVVAGITARDPSGAGDNVNTDDADAPASGGKGNDDDKGLKRGGVLDARLMPAALFYDPALIETTPQGVLCASAMNGFDKGIETLYAATSTPLTDGTAVRGLRLLRQGLPRLGEGRRDEETLSDVIVGTVLVQYGSSRGDGLTLSLIHAFGHGIARGYDIQQGGAHGIIAPHALRFLFDRVDARRHLLAEAFDLETDDPDQQADGVIEAVTAVRDALGLPTRLRGITDMSEGDLPAIAEDVWQDSFMSNVPADLDPTVEDLEDVLREAW